MTGHITQNIFQDPGEATIADNDLLNCSVPYLYGRASTISGQVSALGDTYSSGQHFGQDHYYSLGQNYNSGQCHPLNQNVSFNWNSFPVVQQTFTNEGLNTPFKGTRLEVPGQRECWQPINQGASKASNISQPSANETPTQTPAKTPSPPPPQRQGSHDSPRTPSPPRSSRKRKGAKCVPNSCLRCQRRKQSCKRPVEGEPCERCSEAGVECKTGKPDRRKKIGKKSIPEQSVDNDVDEDAL